MTRTNQRELWLFDNLVDQSEATLGQSEWVTEWPKQRPGQFVRNEHVNTQHRWPGRWRNFNKNEFSICVYFILREHQNSVLMRASRLPSLFTNNHRCLLSISILMFIYCRKDQEIPDWDKINVSLFLWSDEWCWDSFLIRDNTWYLVKTWSIWRKYLGNVSINNLGYFFIMK